MMSLEVRNADEYDTEIVLILTTRILVDNVTIDVSAHDDVVVWSVGEAGDVVGTVFSDHQNVMLPVAA